MCFMNKCHCIYLCILCKRNVSSRWHDINYMVIIMVNHKLPCWTCPATHAYIQGPLIQSIYKTLTMFSAMSKDTMLQHDLHWWMHAFTKLNHVLPQCIVFDDRTILKRLSAPILIVLYSLFLSPFVVVFHAMLVFPLDMWKKATFCCIFFFFVIFGLRFHANGRDVLIYA